MAQRADAVRNACQANGWCDSDAVDEVLAAASDDKERKALIAARVEVQKGAMKRGVEIAARVRKKLNEAVAQRANGPGYLNSAECIARLRDELAWVEENERTMKDTIHVTMHGAFDLGMAASLLGDCWACTADAGTRCAEALDHLDKAEAGLRTSPDE